MPRYIDKDKLLLEANGGKDVFSHYFTDFEGYNKKVAIRDERTPSASIREFAGIWRITDFGDQETVKGMDAISWVMFKENLPYYESLLFIESVILRRQVSSDGWIAPKWRAEYSSREFNSDDKVGQYHYEFKEPTTKDLESIGAFVTAEHLKHFSCRCLKRYEYCGFSKKLNKNIVHIYTATDDYPMFVFDYGKYRKIYKPHEQDKAYRFIWDNPDRIKFDDEIFGLSQIKRANNEFIDTESDEENKKPVSLPKGKPNAVVIDLFRCSGESDALNLFSLGFHVYWLNSETIGYGQRFKDIDNLCENHYQIFDLDKTGRIQANKTAMKHFTLKNVPLPEWLTNKKDFRGNPCKDIKDYINTFENVETASKAFKNLKDGKARSVKFWEYDKDTKRMSFNPINYLFFIEVSGFARMTYSLDKNKDFCYVFVENKIVKIMSSDLIKSEIRSHTLAWIQAKSLPNEMKVLNAFLTTKALPEGILETLPLIDISLENHSKDTEYIHFKNCSLKITADDITMVKHSDVPNYILGAFLSDRKKLSHICDFTLKTKPPTPISIELSENYSKLLTKKASTYDESTMYSIDKEIAQIAPSDMFSFTFGEMSIFPQFIRDLSRIHWRKETEYKETLSAEEVGMQNLSLANLMYVIGYLLAQHKLRSKAWAVFIQDMKVSAIGESSGRSGKSLIVEAIKHVRLVKSIAGRQMDNKDKMHFMYEGYTEFHDIKDIDDLHERADFEQFYNEITGTTTVNAKHIAQVDLFYEQSGKMVFTTNYELPRMTGSTTGRILNAGASDFYHIKSRENDYLEDRTPATRFGKQLFTDFTDREWNEFYWFMAYCLQLYMRMPRINPPMENIEKRQLRRELSNGLGRGEHFLNWANEYFVAWNPADGKQPYQHYDDSDDVTKVAYFNSYFSATIALNDFKRMSGLADARAREFTAHRFRDKLAKYCEYIGCELNPEDMMDASNKNRKVMKNPVSYKAEAFFYIRREGAAQSEPTPDYVPDNNDIPWNN